jgi:hypothetical protein
MQCESGTGLVTAHAGRRESAMVHIPPFTNFDPETAATLRAAYNEAIARLIDQPDFRPRAYRQASRHFGRERRA